MIATTVHAEELDVVGSAPAGVEAVRITSITFEATGMSRREPLLYVSTLEVGETFATLELLHERLVEARQNLMNRRVFDGIRVEWRVAASPFGAERAVGGTDATAEADAPEAAADAPEAAADAPEAAADAPADVDVLFLVDDGWTLLPIPFYRYNSNSGHNPFVVFYWDNFLGTLTDFGMSAGYYSRDWVTPFRWDVTLDWRRLRFWGREWNFRVRQMFDTVEQADPNGDVEFAYQTDSTEFSLRTGFALGPRYSYSISPSISADYGTNTLENEIGASVPPSRTALGFSHSVGTGRIDWIGNVRRGWGASISNGISFDPRTADLNTDAGIGYSRHWLPHPRIGPAIRVRLDHQFDGDRLGRGGAIRGVADNRVFGQTMVAASGQVTFLAIDWRRVTDIQLIPFVDGAVTRKQDEPITTEDLFVGFGVDVVAFPDFIRGFEARVSIGFDVREIGSTPPSVEIAITESLQF